MSELCPFCGERKVFVGVHDDEGNYHGPLGCEYEQDPWSGLSYALHHEGWGDCILCTDGENQVMGGILYDSADEAISDLRQQTNETLTIEELLQMDGEPVWVEYPEMGLRLWVILEGERSMCVVEGGKPVKVDGIHSSDGRTFRKSFCGSKWFAYRRKPEEGSYG